jgi:hypothetical protein
LMKAHQSKSGAGGRAGSIADYSSQLGLVARELSRGDETATALCGTTTGHFVYVFEDSKNRS